MKIPDEFVHRIVKTRMTFFGSDIEKINEIKKYFPGIELNIIHENLQRIIVLVFKTQEDCLAFTLKYGNNYV